MNGQSRSLKATVGLMVVTSLVVAGLTGLGIWQLQRRTWKLDLIARVDRHMHAVPVPAPGPADWSNVTADRDEYRAVTLQGHYLAGHQSYVAAVSDFGSGYWVITPFRTDRGFVVLVNRGFAPPQWRHSAATRTQPPAGHLTLKGLLRLSEPGGAFLRSNVPAEGRWYSRDVAAMAAAQHLGVVAPYFIDRGAQRDADWPRGGMTVIRFANSHLVYALTWFGLALLVAILAIRSHRHRPDPQRQK